MQDPVTAKKFVGLVIQEKVIELQLNREEYARELNAEELVEQLQAKPAGIHPKTGPCPPQGEEAENKTVEAENKGEAAKQKVEKVSQQLTRTIQALHATLPLANKLLHPTSLPRKLDFSDPYYMIPTLTVLLCFQACYVTKRTVCSYQRVV